MRLGTFGSDMHEMAGRNGSEVVTLTVTEEDLPALYQFAAVGRSRGPRPVLHPPVRPSATGENGQRLIAPITLIEGS